MTASAASPLAARAPWLAALALALWLAAGCAGPTPTPTAPLEPLGLRAASAPGDRDLAARDLAAAVLAETPTGTSLAALAALEQARRGAGAAPSGLPAYARDAANAGLEPGPRRAATQALLDEDVPEALDARLEKELADDPLLLARSRLRDARWQRFGRRSNAVIEPLGRSIASLALLPLRLVPALVNLAVAEHAAPELSTPERQALDHWKHFIERNPDAPQAAALLARVERSQRRWYRTQRDKALRGARRAWRAGDAAASVVLAERALRYAPEDRAASALLAEAEARAARERAERARSLAAPGEVDLGGQALARALLVPAGDVTGEAEALLAEQARGARADEARFALALAEAEAGQERASWKRLEKLARARDHRSAMARHARALVESPESNPHRAWRMARRAARGDGWRWLLFGPLARGARQRDLPRPVEWLVEIPTLLPVVLGLPDRLIRLPFARSSRRSPGVFARRYLERFPDGEDAVAMRRWLVGYESSRGRPLAALRTAQQDPDFDPKRLAKLTEEAAEQLLSQARDEKRLDRRVTGLRRVVELNPTGEAAREAGALLRETVAGASAQQIRISRGFLEENPQVAGPRGLGLRTELLDGEPGNGELHARGVTLLGGRELELAFLAPNGRESEAPSLQRQRISAERLARTVTLLEEASLRNARLDQDQPFAPDADRDLFFERVRFGLAETGPRVTARSTFVYEGVRERYGLVRGRESVLPIDFVLRGSLSDLGLGGFPRVRPPRETPDAFLYR